MHSRESDTLAAPTIWLPKDIEEAWSMKQQLQDACFISAGTLLQLEWEKGKHHPHHLISLENLEVMRGVSLEQGAGEKLLRIGSLTTLSAVLRNSQISQYTPILIKAAQGIAAPAVRNRATIGGNVANGCGDMIPALLVLDALVAVFDGDCLTEKPLCQWLEERKTNPASSPLLVEIKIPVQKQAHYFYEKVGRREAFIPSAVTIAGCYRQAEEKHILFIRLAAGGGDTAPQRLVCAEELLYGACVRHTLLEHVHESIQEEFQPIGDRFSSTAYRKQVAANLIVSELAYLEE